MEAWTSCAGTFLIFLSKHHIYLFTPPASLPSKAHSLRFYKPHVLTLNRPDFDSPTVFGRLLDADRGGYFTIAPSKGVSYTTKQQYLPSSNILQTRYIHEEGAMDLIDFFPRPKNTNVLAKQKQMPFRETVLVQDELKKWLVRRVECIRGYVDISMSHLIQLAPTQRLPPKTVLMLTYAQTLKSSQHSTTLVLSIR
jgi:hypothetical protein